MRTVMPQPYVAREADELKAADVALVLDLWHIVMVPTNPHCRRWRIVYCVCHDKGLCKHKVQNVSVDCAANRFLLVKCLSRMPRLYRGHHPYPDPTHRRPRLHA